MQKFKYKIIPMPVDQGGFNETLGRPETFLKSPKKMTDILNVFGQNGWELCAFASGMGFMFKKRLPESQ